MQFSFGLEGQDIEVVIKIPSFILNWKLPGSYSYSTCQESSVSSKYWRVYISPSVPPQLVAAGTQEHK